MISEQGSIFVRAAAAALCLLQTSACITSGAVDPCDLSRLEEVGEPLLEKGDFTGLYDLYLPCARRGVPEAEFFIAILISDIESNILQLEKEEREAEMLKWICRSAIHGFDEAIETIADSYQWGWFDLPKDPEREACWRKKLVNPDASIHCECPPE